MTRSEIEACWRDPKNRRWGVYYCKADPRAIVPKRYKWMGWTINAARPSAIPALLLLMGILVAPVFILGARQASNTMILIGEAIAIGVVCLISAYLSSRTG